MITDDNYATVGFTPCFLSPPFKKNTHTKKKHILPNLGGGFNPVEKILVKLDQFPKEGFKKQYLPAPSKGCQLNPKGW